ncbi:hypothetical protein [Paenibacillus sp. MMS18-CY102]|uniref:hypothetical protein n=1 Tax=Paenibacillus sp. MMS18-CY102 TaxID=2682849 RepID=UPI0013A9849E|nr:hypothetical protein [Paenibacillus sp. MMS18-CY102]MWC29421.1 hypothetical protein [Paenibacillus sp. MMS18-CY102]
MRAGLFLCQSNFFEGQNQYLLDVYYSDRRGVPEMGKWTGIGRGLIVLSAIAVLAMLLVSCGASTKTPLDYKDKVSGVDLGAENKEFAEWGLTEQQVKEHRGKPLRRLKADGETVILEYADYQYSIVNGHVAGYTLMPKHKTAKGLQIGDRQSSIAESYGKDFYARKQKSNELIGYIDKQREQVLEFVISSDRIVAIIVSEFGMFR